MFFKRERKRTRNHSIACSFACSSAQNADMLVSGVLLLSTVKKLDHTCSFFWAHFLLQFFPPVVLPWSTLAKVDIFGPMFSAAFSYSTWCNINKKPSKNHIGGNRKGGKCLELRVSLIYLAFCPLQKEWFSPLPTKSWHVISVSRKTWPLREMISARLWCFCHRWWWGWTPGGWLLARVPISTWS